MRFWIAEHLRYLADRIHRPSAFKAAAPYRMWWAGRADGFVVDEHSGAQIWIRGDDEFKEIWK